MAIARKIALRLELCWQSLRIEQYQVTAKDNQRTARKLIVANIGFPRGRRTYIVVRNNWVQSTASMRETRAEMVSRTALS